MTKLSIETCTKALNSAALNRKAAFQIELAVGLSMFMVEGESSKAAKSNLCAAYASAGYQCLKIEDADYKTINRRINATADLFNHVSLQTVKKWAGRHAEDNLIDAVVLGLEPYELVSVMDVMRLCAPPEPINAAPKPQTQVVAPAHDILKGPNAKGQEKIVAMFRRAADKVAEGAQHIETAHLALMIPPTTTRDELVELAGKLLVLAEEKKKDLQPA